ncbi:uncharacterized protein LOC132654341 [Meriones unguiculatus]|uniref:uncharacterized protein LOC132654341 n=1 Tax=Meriones unguiculatus TaxID=10047 RepID=UPI00293EF14B|nr:uncharacterized protein LOC132654341 [Meriones unguiculatus]
MLIRGSVSYQNRSRTEPPQRLTREWVAPLLLLLLGIQGSCTVLSLQAGGGSHSTSRKRNRSLQTLSSKAPSESEVPTVERSSLPQRTELLRMPQFYFLGHSSSPRPCSIRQGRQGPKGFQLLDGAHAARKRFHTSWTKRLHRPEERKSTAPGSEAPPGKRCRRGGTREVRHSHSPQGRKGNGLPLAPPLGSHRIGNGIPKAGRLKIENQQCPRPPY